MLLKILPATKVNFVSVHKAEIIPYHSCITAVFGTICVHVHMTLWVNTDNWHAYKG